MGDSIRVMLADDSAVIRGLVSKWIEAERDLALVGSAVNGVEALRLAAELKPDVLILDIEMPQKSGLEALPELLRSTPGTRVLMSSTLTHRGAEVTLRALSLGAADYVTKPETGQAAAADFRRQLIEKVRALGGARQRQAAAPARPSRPMSTASSKLKPPARIEALVIGCSTGGPQALRAVLPPIAAKVSAPILIVQHMPPVFTTILAQHLSQAAGREVVEPKDGAPIVPNGIYLAPGDHHMRVTAKFGAPRIELDRSAPVNFCRPAVDPLFMSASDVYGANVLGLVLTGMGSDGKRGAERIIAKGGGVLAQDEATSVVWGMPGAVAQAQLCYNVLPLQELGPAIVGLSGARRL
jgi:two-component system chemotaxis response regulator CheB